MFDVNSSKFSVACNAKHLRQTLLRLQVPEIMDASDKKQKIKSKKKCKKVNFKIPSQSDELIDEQAM